MGEDRIACLWCGIRPPSRCGDEETALALCAERIKSKRHDTPEAIAAIAALTERDDSTS